jgi:aminoglycoside phosphotransferase
MPRSTPSLQDNSKWANGLRREMRTAIGQQLRVIFQLPQEIAPELKSLASRIDKQRTERYADIVGTC